VIEPKISLVAYRDLGGGKKIFVMVPDEMNRWMKTDLCVGYVGCEHCGALIGEPCYEKKTFNSFKSKKYASSVHNDRKIIFKRSGF